MLINFRCKKGGLVSRTYGINGTGYAPLPSKTKIDDHRKFTWTVDIVKNLIAIFSAIFISALGFGILAVLISIQLEKNIESEILMSFSSAAQIAAGVIFAQYLPALGRKFGLVNSVYLGSIICAICSLVIFKYPGYLLWLVIIYILGTAFFICGVTRNTLLIDMAPKHVRAMIISTGAMLVAVGNSFGPIILNLLKTGNSFFSYALASLLFLLSMPPLMRLKKVESKIRTQKRISIWRYIKNSPKIMLAGFCVSYTMSATSAFLIIYGLKIGMNQENASLLLSVLLMGTVFYIPLGYLTDHFNRRFLMISCSFLSLFCIHYLYLNHGSKEIYPLLFLLFGCLSGMKLPAIVLINEKYKSTQRLAVNSAFSKFGLIGNVVGLIATGWCMQHFGPSGLWLSTMSILLFFLVFCLINYLIKISSGQMDRKDLTIFLTK